MASPDANPAAIEPSELAGRMFGTRRKGFDPDEVRDFLRSVAKAVTALQAERDDLARRLADAEARPADVPELDEDRLTAALGEETARVLATARQAAAEIRSKAEASVARLLQEAGDEASATRAAAAPTA